MNKLEPINNLKEECQISKNEAAMIVDLFFNKISDALADGDRVKIRGLCFFLSKNINPIRGGILEPARLSPWLPKSCRFLRLGKN